MLSNPIFIIGTERSGSNLLRLLLNTHTKITVPHPPHLMRDMAFIEREYGDLAHDENFLKLADDAAKLVNMHFSPWPFPVIAEDLCKRAEHRSLYGLYAALYDLFAEHNHKKRWGCKSTFMYQQIETILQQHSEPRFLHLVRDPRDVAASAGESIFSKFHPYNEALLWQEQQAEIEKWRDRMTPAKYLSVRYEDLTAAPEKETRRIMQFLNEDFEPAQMQFFQTREANQLAGLSQSWKNVSEPVSTKSVGRYKSRLSETEIRQVESVCWELMKKYGYESEYRTQPTPPDFGQRRKINLYENLKKIEVETKALFTDKNFVLRWKRWFYLKYIYNLRRNQHGS